ncbi:hypothetical protein LNKW23_14510 [Paralimibaculum aggregatum]|uniref:Uncharacterized protein n=1 Tax=Paralimibaculum aggregatum TaxID=3036245 RepID=A0ABQ6LN37_9RHOB|nr:hypothetical protein [Limibaculum sp. NKW23]GMG82238.1 hypothetical protein LNKW23_14510 [Limibaculum sp. NKW23]
MAELTEFEIDWIEKAAKKKITVVSMDKAERKLEQKLSVLNELIDTRLEDARGQIDAAQQFSVEQRSSSDFLNALWAKMGKKGGKITEIKWRAEDSDLGFAGYETTEDIEVDTVNDLVRINEVPEETLDALADSFAKILEISKQMAREIDEDGERLFTDDEIRRELWTPLVRDGLIPENMVPDKFSDHAIAFKGAAEIYQSKINEFSKKSTGKEGLLRGLEIAADTASLLGTIGSSAVTIHQAGDMAQINQELNEQSSTDTSGMTPEQVKEHDKVTANLKAEQSRMQNIQKAADIGAASLTGVLEIAKEGVKATEDKEKQGRWNALVDKSLSVLGSIAASAVDPITRAHVGHDSVGDGSAKSALATSAAIKAGITGGIAAVRLGPALIAVAIEKDEQKRIKLIEDCVNRFADAVGQAIKAVATDYATTDKGKQGNLEIVASVATASIKALGKGPAIMKALDEGNYKKAAILLGGGVLEGTMMGVAGAISDASKRNVTKEEYYSASFEEKLTMEIEGSETTELKRDQLTAALTETSQSKIDTMAQSLADAVDSLSTKPDNEAAAEFQEKLAKQLAEKTQKDAEEAIEKEFGDPEAVKAMFDEFETTMVGYEDLYKDAVPDTELAGKPPDEVERSLAAVDRAIAKTAELRAKAELINGLSGSAAGIVAAFVPGGGAVVAAQKVLYDIYCLSQAVQAHNKWCESMELAFRASSAYGPAIEKTMKNARITLAYNSVKMVLDAFKCGSEIGRCFDPTGAATVASAVASISAAFHDYCHKMHKQAEITFGWKAYKKARENPGNRKAARKALRMNSTLAKCCIAYGAVMEGDAAAKDAIKRCGISPAMLASDTDVCKRLVSFLENELSDDPVVMHVEKQAKNWAPGKPMLTPISWFEIKAAALTTAVPALSPVAAKTPAIDRLLADLDKLWEGKKSYTIWKNDWKDALYKTKVKEVMDTLEEGAKPTREQVRGCKLAAEQETEREAARKAGRTIELLNQISQQFEAYRPVQVSGLPHEDMVDIAKTYVALCRLNTNAATVDA